MTTETTNDYKIETTKLLKEAAQIALSYTSYFMDL